MNSRNCAAQNYEMTQMVRLIPAGIITGTAMLGAAAGNFIEEHNMGLPAVLGVMGVVLPAAWWLSRRLTKIDDRFDINDTRLKGVEERVADQLHRIELAIARLPCTARDDCPEPKRPKPPVKIHPPYP